MLSPNHYNNICITKSQVISTNYGVFPTYICKSIHPMTKVTGVLDIIHKKEETVCEITLVSSFVQYGVRVSNPHLHG